MDISSPFRLTILTPTYNRRAELPKLAASLDAQTQKGFQWLVIDDGSSDDTESFVQSLRPDGYEIEYHRKENGGKHTALNYSHPFIKGEYVCIVDSDDYLTPDAVESIYGAIERYGHNQKIACYSFPRGGGGARNFGEPLVKGFPTEPIISNHIDFRINGNRGGDCCEVERASVFREFPFPVFPGERFMSEGYLWVNMGMKYDTVYIGKVIYLCEYLEGGLSKSGRKLRIQCPLGGMENCNAFLSVGGDRKLNLKTTLKEMWLYICYGKFAGFSYREMRQKCRRSFLLMANYPLGVLLYWIWKKKYA